MNADPVEDRDLEKLLKMLDHPEVIKKITNIMVRISHDEAKQRLTDKEKS